MTPIGMILNGTCDSFTNAARVRATGHTFNAHSCSQIGASRVGAGGVKSVGIESKQRNSVPVGGLPYDRIQFVFGKLLSAKLI